MKGEVISTRSSVDRRWVLRGVAAAGLGAGASAFGCAPSGGADITAEAIDGDSALFTGAGANVFAASTSDGVLMVDTGSAEHGDALVRAVSRQFSGARPVAAFNTQWRHSHTGGNAAVKAAGAKIYAHENTRLWLQGDFYVPWEDRHYDPQPEAMWPTDTFYTGGEMSVSGRDVAYIHMKKAMTDGDLVIHLKDADIIVAGDLVAIGAYPIFDWYTGGWIGAYSRATDAMLELAGPDTKIVPGTGPVVGKDHLETQKEMLDTVRERIYAQVRLGKSPQEMLDARVTEGFDEAWGDPTQFVMNSYPGIWAHAGEIGGVV